MGMGDDGAIVGGRVYSESDIPSRLMKYGRDKKALNFMTLYEKNTISVLRVISEKFGTLGRQDVPGFEMKYPSISELPYEFTPHAVSVDDNTAKTSVVSFANDDAACMYPGLVLFIKGICIDSKGTLVSTTKSVDTIENEQAMVEYVDRADSYASGYTNVKIKRFYPIDGPTATVEPITTSMQLILVNSLSKEDAGPNPPISKNNEEDFNYIQTTRASWGVSEHVLSGIETYLNKLPFELAYELCQKAYVKLIERAMLTGKRSKKRIGKDMLYQSGGVLEYIPSDNIIDFSSTYGQIITPETFMKMLTVIGDTVGSFVDEYWMFNGTQFHYALTEAFAGKALFTQNEMASIKYRMNVLSFTTPSRNIQFNIVPAPILNELGMADESLVLNLTESQKCFQIAEKVPTVEKPEDGGSLSPVGVYNKIRELYSMWGMIRRHPNTHFRIFNVSTGF
jgi:hypothetical protein